MATIQPRYPIQIFKDNTQEEKKENARLTLFTGAIAVAELVKTTLGPKGMDKILQSMSEHGEIQITNDGATILKSLYIDNPAAKVIVDISKTQDDEVGDGTTSVVVLAGELLREAEKLINERKIHPQIIIEGWREAANAAKAALEASAVNNSTDSEKFKQDLLNIARTTLSSKILGHGYKEHFSNLAVQAVTRLKGSTNLDMIHIIKKIGAGLEDSFLDNGFILEKKIGVGQPKRLEKAKILLANTPMDNDKVKIFGAKVEADSPEQIALIEKAERERMIAKCQKIIKHDINCFINRQLIYNLPEQFFADHGVMAIEHADFEGVERLALVTGAEIVSTFDDPKRVKLGHCDLIEEIMIGEDKMIRFSGVERGEACTIVLRGPTEQILEEAERSLHDVLCVLSQTVANEHRVVIGAGCSEALMARAVDEVAKKTGGKKSIAIEAFANALLRLPTILAENAGLDGTDLVAKLRAEHNTGNSTAGLDINNGVVGNAAALHITESFKVKSQMLASAQEAAEMILRIDEIIKAPPRARERDPRYA
eukprot:TRINITY_DN2832_c0_g1_i1.p1 TRINITY_DN2832_c0_g1~~TRINITY_DN2832_c0_g1_i1.p1  ORF type:complete len:540 (+),score=183.76 TRINITY_DN2832_c0_g1_i1:1178-2797(+)